MSKLRSHSLGICSELNKLNGFPGGAVVKNMPANAGDAGEVG